MQYIYNIVGLKDNRLYIGRTDNPIKRKQRHFNDLKNNKHHCIFLQRAFNKYGEDNFEFEIIEEIETLEEVQNRELYYLNTLNNLYNTSAYSSGGDLISYHPNRDAIVERIRNSIIERYRNMTKEEKQLLSERMTGKGNPNYGNKGIKNPLFQKPKDKEHRNNISKALTGRKLSNIHIEKVRLSKMGSIPWNKGLKLPSLSKEHKRKISKALSDREQEHEWIPVVCENIYFPSVKFASDCYNVSKTTIINRCNSDKEKWKVFFYFNKDVHNTNDYEQYTENSTNKVSLKFKGDNRRQAVCCEGKTFESLKLACDHFGFSSSNAIKYRIESKLEKWKNYYYL